MRFFNPSKKPRIINSVHGHSIAFPGYDQKAERVFVHVPPSVQEEAIAAGLLPEEEIQEVETPVGPVEPTNPDKRREAIHVAFDKLIERGGREDFSGNSLPNTKALDQMLGWPVPKTEIKSLWDAYQQLDRT